MNITYTFEARLWRWDAQQAVWIFATLPEGISDEIDDAHSGLRAGFGSVKVRVSIGSTTWETSIFPSKENAGYILPVKKPVRSAEGLKEGDVAHVTLTTLV